MDKLYSLKSVLELADGDESFVRVLVDTFLEEIPIDLQKMSDAVEKNDANNAYQSAHKMKPNFLLFGIDVVDHVRLIESWSEGEIEQDEAKPSLSYIKDMAYKALKQLENDFKK